MTLYSLVGLDIAVTTTYNMFSCVHLLPKLYACVMAVQSMDLQIGVLSEVNP